MREAPVKGRPGMRRMRIWFLSWAVAGTSIELGLWLMLAQAPEPAVLVRELDAFLYEHFGNLGLLVTFFLAQIDPRTGAVTYCGAGHPPALIVRHAGGVELLRSETPVLALGHEWSEAARSSHATMERGDVLVLYTDGITEAHAPHRELFGEARLIETVKGALGEGAEQVALAVLDAAARVEPGPRGRLVAQFERQVSRCVGCCGDMH